MLKLIVFIVLSFASSAFAAICSCDAPPSCGRIPPGCFRREANPIVGKTYVSDQVSFKERLSIKQIVSPGVIAVESLVGESGERFIVMTSRNTFNLMYKAAPNVMATIVDKFSFEDGRSVDVLVNSKGISFVRTTF